MRILCVLKSRSDCDPVAPAFLLLPLSQFPERFLASFSAQSTHSRLHCCWFDLKILMSAITLLLEPFEWFPVGSMIISKFLRHELTKFFHSTCMSFPNYTSSCLLSSQTLCPGVCVCPHDMINLHCGLD